MGAFLDKPKTEKHTEQGGGNGLRYGLSSMQGWRIEMEDAHCAVIGIPELNDWSFFAGNLLSKSVHVYHLYLIF